MTTHTAPTVTTTTSALAGVTCTAWSAYAGTCGEPAVVKSTGYWSHENWASCADCKALGDAIRSMIQARRVVDQIKDGEV